MNLRDYQGVVGTFLMDLALPIVIYLLDYFLPQLNPTERCINTLDIMAAPVRYAPQLMTLPPCAKILTLPTMHLQTLEETSW